MKSIKVKNIVMILFIIAPFIFVKAQTKEDNKINLSGNIFLDSKYAVIDYNTLNNLPEIQNPQKKSQYVAGLMSF